MANIKLTLPAEPFSKQIVTFTAPCNCDEVTDGLVINGETYTVCDAMGECVTGKGGAWCAGAQISVVLDCENKKAYLQNGKPTPNMIGAASEAEHIVKHYGDLADIGLSDTDMSSTDVVANLAAIYNAMPMKSELWRLLASSQSNCPTLYASLNAKFQTDTGNPHSSAFLMRITKQSYVLEVTVTSQNTAYCGYEYSCMLRYANSGSTLSAFTATRDPNGFVSKLSNYGKVATGSYVGTGTCGASNPNTIVCGFAPKMIVIVEKSAASANIYQAIWAGGMTEGAINFRGGTFAKITWNADGVSWYEENAADAQLNASDTTYGWTAIG